MIIISSMILVKIADIIISLPLINRYKMYGVFGKPGSGKSTFLTSLAYKHVKNGWIVYSDDPTINIDGVQYFDSMAFKNGEWLPDGRKGKPSYINTKDKNGNSNGEINKEDKDIILLFDEMGSLYNNRDFKTNLTPETLRFWKEHRHKRVKVIYGSQSYKDTDLKVRQLSDQLWLIKRGKLLNSFSIARPILITLDIQNNENTETSGGQIVEKYSYDLIFFWKFIYLQYWIKKFNSYR